MRLSLLCAALSGLLLAALAYSQGNKPDPYAEHIAPGKPKAAADEKKDFVLPPGFEAQLVAAEPDIQKPMNLAFDDRGRLWVTDSVEYPFPVARNKKGRDTVKVLEDFGPDGKAGKITTFADGLNIPIGVLPLPFTGQQEALVHSIPNIWKVSDTTGRAKADQRAVFLGPYQFRDTHGMTSAFTLGFDGWVYACHGYANTSTIKARAGPAVTMNSGNTYRFRPDGGRLEQFTWGQVNPFGLSLDPFGNLYSADCHSQPIYQLIRGAYYPSFGKPHDGLGFGPETITNYKGSTAIAGITYYAADHFPKDYRGHAFVGDVVTNQIVLFKLSWKGSSPTATQHVFLDSKDRWFRPVDIKLGPDGALYAADFYNRIIGHYEVPLTHPGRDRHRGRIWRIVYKGKGGGTLAPLTDWSKATPAQLVEGLKRDNLTARLQALNQLVARGDSKVIPLLRALFSGKVLSHQGADQRACAVWALERLRGLDEATLKRALEDEATPRLHALRVLAERPALTGAQRDSVLARLKSSLPGSERVQRAAVEALGRHPCADNVEPLLGFLAQPQVRADAHLHHTARIALRDSLRLAASWKAAARITGDRQRGLIADVAPGVHSADSASFLLGYLRKISTPRQGEFVHQVARHGDAGTVKGLLAYARADHPERLAHQAELFKAVQRGTQERGTALGADARTWGVGLAQKLLASQKAEELKLGAELVGSLRLEGPQKKLVELATSASAGAAERQAALEALAAIDAGKHAGTLGKVLADASTPLALREHACGVLARANRAETRAQLVAALAAAPARLQNRIALDLASSRDGAEQLLKTIAAGKASPRLLQERPLVLRLESARLPGFKDRLKKLTRGLPPADEKLQALLAARRKGFLAAKSDAGRGLKVFEKHCANCHQIGGKGAKIGPQLDGIGLRGLDRLLEDTLDPSRNVDEAFRLTTLNLKKGQSIPGLVLREEGAVVVLADNQGKEVRVAKKDIEQRTVSPLSPMPGNFAEVIPEAEFHDLMAYLLAQRAPKR
jgi:putative heme-binding domain-containing protein